MVVVSNVSSVFRVLSWLCRVGGDGVFIWFVLLGRLLGRWRFIWCWWNVSIVWCFLVVWCSLVCSVCVRCVSWLCLLVLCWLLCVGCGSWWLWNIGNRIVFWLVFVVWFGWSVDWGLFFCGIFWCILFCVVLGILCWVVLCFIVVVLLCVDCLVLCCVVLVWFWCWILVVWWFWLCCRLCGCVGLFWWSY